MASAFWTLEDGRVFAKRWIAMACLLDLITIELKEIEDAQEFYEYLEYFVFREENGDEFNGYGGFFKVGKDIMFNFDLRSFTPTNREYFWQATQRALTKIKIENNSQNEGIDFLLTTLLDMHKRINQRENPLLLNHSTIIEPETNKKLGPGW